MIIHVHNVDDYKKEIAEGKVLVDFYAEWCGPCKMLSPVIEASDKGNELGETKVVKVDVDECPDIASIYRVQSIPTLIVFENGKIKKTTLGYLNKNQLIELLK